MQRNSEHVLRNSQQGNSLLLRQAVFHDSALFLDSYLDVFSRILSIYDGTFSPFRPAALSSWRRSSLLFSTLKFLASVYQSSLTTVGRLRLAAHEAQLDMLQQLSFNLSNVHTSLQTSKDELLLVVVMFGLSSSWYDLDDLGLEHYNAAVALLEEAHFDKSRVHTRNYQFFRESLIYWWMMLSFAADPSSQTIRGPPCLERRDVDSLYVPHPLTGVSPESQLLLGRVGFLVFSHSREFAQRHLRHDDKLMLSRSNTARARDLETRLLSLELPAREMIVDPGDSHTPINDLINIAEAYRMCGLLMLYRVFPDLLDVRLRSADSDDSSDLFAERERTRQQWLNSLALCILEQLEENSETSGTRTIEAILLLIVSGELSVSGQPLGATGYFRDLDSTKGSIYHQSLQRWSSKAQKDARAVVLARFERIQAILPFQTIDRMKSIVFKAWESMDNGSNLFWVDIMIKNKWQFLML